MRVPAVLALIVIGLAAPAFGQDNQTPQAAPTAGQGDAAHGHALAQRWCSICHNISGSPENVGAAPSFAAIAHDPKRGPDTVRTVLAHRHKPVLPSSFSPGDIDDLVAYLGALPGR